MKKLLFILFLFIGIQSFGANYSKVCHEGETVIINLTELFRDVDPGVGEGLPMYIIIHNGIVDGHLTKDDEGIDYYVLLNIQVEQSGIYTFIREYENISIRQDVTIIVLPGPVPTLSMCLSYPLTGSQRFTDALKPQEITFNN